MPNMQYDSGGLGEGARLDRRSADGADATEATLRRGTISASAFGNVGNAARIAGQVGDTRRRRAEGAQAAGVHRDDQGDRADSAAGQGDGLTARSTVTATSAPRTVAQ